MKAKIVFPHNTVSIISYSKNNSLGDLEFLPMYGIINRYYTFRIEEQRNSISSEKKPEEIKYVEAIRIIKILY